ncbi:MAG: hypothetical protein ABIR91_00390 [Candidatus Saccharimonadales bacterium]
MDFLKSSKRRSSISEFVYIVLNIGFAVAILAIVLIESPLLAFALVLLGKWRILAVRPRYWFVNLQTNLVDLIVSISVVVLLSSAHGALAMQILLTLLYIGWLLVIKPKSKKLYIAIQAGTAVFLGVSALMIVSASWFATPVVLLMWLIGYSSARNVLSSHSEPYTAFYSLIWGFVFAEFGWLAYHWTFAYSLPGMGTVKLVQIAIIVTALSFLAERLYSSYARHGEIKSADIILPALLSVSTVMILLLFFNQINTGVL